MANKSGEHGQGTVLPGHASWRGIAASSAKAGGEPPDMTDHPTRQEVADKVAIAEAHTDTKFAELLGKIEVANMHVSGEIKNLGTHLDGIEKSTSGIKATIVGAAIAVVAVVIGVLAFGQQWFGIGVATRDIIRSTVSEMQIQHVPTPPPAPATQPPH